MDGERVISAFTEEQAANLTGLSRRQLQHWDRSRFFAPQFADANRRRAFSRIYSFRDLLCLKVLNALRNNARVSLQHLREVKERLAHLGDDMWAKTTLYVLDGRVIFVNPETSQREDAASGQLVLQIPLRVITGDMETAVRSMQDRDEADIGKIARHRGVAHNKAVVAGTRIPVSAIKSFHKAGYSVRQIRAEYPSLTEEDIEAALAHSEAA